MNYSENNGAIIVTELTDFNIKETLECGQCFRFEKLNEMHYKIIAMDRILYIKQDEKEVIFYPCSLDDFEKIWINYFDFNTDYAEIKRSISNDEIIKKATEYAGGIRILNQDRFECLLSFIISQNNNIPRIKGIIANMSKKYGTKLENDYLFPSLEQLKNVTVDELMELRMGFRAKYIYDCIQKLCSGDVDIYNIDLLTTDELLKNLLVIKGVGQKVADCTMLFSMNRREVFPTDVWVKRVMQELYFDGNETDIKAIHSFAKNKWGNLAGYAQQYLFYYARSLKIGSK